MKEHAIRIGYPFPYLYDETQEVAKAYDAACTPDFYIFDNNKILAYRGGWILPGLIQALRLQARIFAMHSMPF